VSPASAAFIDACRAEIEAPKPGNVHVFAPGHDMEASLFTASAMAAAVPVTTVSQRVGERIEQAVEASMRVAGTNTNLGIILLCAPLAMAFELAFAKSSKNSGFQGELDNVLEDLDVDDSVRVYRAIRLANPGGMGSVGEHDLGNYPTVPLRRIMHAASGRDRIARAYADGFADIFGLGFSALKAAQAEQIAPWWPATRVYLAFLSAFPDTHVVRKWGVDQAELVQQKAMLLCSTVPASPDPLAELLKADQEIKGRGLNPGTSADLTVATLFAAKLISILQGNAESG
jgi:triphosphoribosyl-dephospho-CoA synthase